jgi:D-alanine transaminase
LNSRTPVIFIVKGGRVATPPKSHRILGGVTRDRVITLARQHGVPLEERPVTLPELRAADEVFLTSTTIEVRPTDSKPRRAVPRRRRLKRRQAKQANSL